MHRFYAPDADETSARLTSHEARHLVEVLRLRVGAEIGVFDGRGREWRARVARASSREVLAENLERRPSVPEPPAAIALAIALLKGDEMDVVVRDATALGVVAILPFASDRVVVPASARQERAVERWTRVAVASAKQCGRAVVPVIASAARFIDLFEARATDHRIVCVEPARSKGIGISNRGAAATATVFVGPEGGWTADEIGLADRGDVEFLSLGPRTLRAGLAPVVALTAIWTQWGWTGAPDARVQR
jgi:16S rRNA (uracil1498-N3)-methyltransferase